MAVCTSGSIGPAVQIYVVAAVSMLLLLDRKVAEAVLVLPLYHRFSPSSLSVSSSISELAPALPGDYASWRLRQSAARGAILLNRLHGRINGQNSFSTIGLTNNDTAVLPLQGGVESLGTYYTVISLGSQKQQVAVIIDTGSSLLWVKCNACLGCEVPSYSPDLSANSSKVDCGNCSQINSQACSGPYAVGCSFRCGPVYRNQQCIAGCSMANGTQCYYVAAYGDKTFTGGRLLRDTLYLGSASDVVSSSIVFGCDTIGTSAVKAPADGLMGLGQSAISVPRQLVASNVLSEDVFAHCLGGEGGGGTLTFGNTTGPDMQFVPMGSDPVLYNISIFDIGVGDVKLNFSRSSFGSVGAVVDSGSTAISLPTLVYNALVNQLLAVLSKNPVLQPLSPEDIDRLAGGPVSNTLKICFAGTSPIGSLGDVFPSFTLFLDGASLVLQPENYLWLFDPLYCLGVYDSAAILGSSTFTILGDFALRNRLTVYDATNRKLGFSSYMDCQH